MQEQEMLDLLNKKFEGVQAELQEAREKGATKAEIETLTESIKTQGQAVEDFIESQTKREIDSASKQLDSFLKENKDKIKEIHKSGHGVVEFTPKAVADMTTGSGTQVGTPDVNWHSDLGGFNLRNDDDLVSAATVSSTGSQLYSYSEMLPKEGGYEFVAEGNAKPKIDFKWENRFASPKKAAAYEVLTEESVTDIVRLNAVARDYLVKQHGLHKANAVYFGDGTGENPTGATVYGRTFVAGDMADAIKTPVWMDIINACITDIYTTQAFEDQAPYMANMVLINPTDFFVQFQSAKDADGKPLYPQASLFNTVTIGGVTIKPWHKIPAGKIFVADMKMYNVINYIPFTIRIGWIDDQFITNKFTMLGESRYFAFVKNLDQAAFIYDDIDVIEQAITKVIPA
jgi:HK97 family phage major capsid protein